ncbi:MAG: response regulator [Microcoleaceae cyanobacterium]
MNLAKILIVEDELIPATNIARNLKKKGYIVLSLVKSGEAAIEKITQEQPDLILMDIHLQGKISGIEAAQEILKHYQIPIIYLTAYSDQATLDQAQQTNPSGYLIKPFKTQQIYEMIETVLQQQSNLASVQPSYSMNIHYNQPLTTD